MRRNEPAQHVIGEPEIIESWSTILPSLSQVPEVPLRRHPPAFFQGNRFLLAALVERVLMELTPGPVVDLYAGVGVFALGAVACGAWH